MAFFRFSHNDNDQEDGPKNGSFVGAQLVITNLHRVWQIRLDHEQWKEHVEYFRSRVDVLKDVILLLLLA